MDSFIYSLVLVPALHELLPKSGIPSTTANVGHYGGLLFALFMIGWGIGLVWGPIRRPLRPRAHHDVQHPLVLAVHIAGRLLKRDLVAGDFPIAGGDWREWSVGTSLV